MDETSEKFISGKIVRGESPLNLEMPFEKLEAFLTPTESFYVRTHFPIPAIDRDAWWLRVEGEVEKPFAINYEQLLEFESITVPVTLECAGNSRNFLEPKVKGVQRIIVTDEPFTGYYQTIDYAYWNRRAEVAELTPLTEMQIKAEIAKPAEGETVPANSSVRVHGAAWTSDGEITKVELSTDGGSTWNETNLLSEPKPNAWRLWEFNWQTPRTPGTQTLIARATDSLGRSQPVLHDADRGTYMINHLLPIQVEVC